MIYALSLAGVAVFAISGALAAGRKGFDLVGVLIVAFVTALGGGTLRDTLLNREYIFWISDPVFLWVILAASGLTILYSNFLRPPYRILLFADALGLALFSILGAQVAEQFSSSWSIIILMGAMTGVAGGVLRDLILNEIPLLCQRTEPIYSVAAVIGICVYLFLDAFSFTERITMLAGVFTIAVVRFAAIIWNIRLPAFTLEEHSSDQS